MRLVSTCFHLFPHESLCDWNPCWGKVQDKTEFSMILTPTAGTWKWTPGRFQTKKPMIFGGGSSCQFSGVYIPPNKNQTKKARKPRLCWIPSYHKPCWASWWYPWVHGEPKMKDNDRLGLGSLKKESITFTEKKKGKLTCPMKINGLKMYFPIAILPFLGNIRSFSGAVPFVKGILAPPKKTNHTNNQRFF